MIKFKNIYTIVICVCKESLFSWRLIAIDHRTRPRDPRCSYVVVRCSRREIIYLRGITQQLVVVVSHHGPGIYVAYNDARFHLRTTDVLQEARCDVCRAPNMSLFCCWMVKGQPAVGHSPFSDSMAYAYNVISISFMQISVGQTIFWDILKRILYVTSILESM